jgi:hypothetical protein
VNADAASVGRTDPRLRELDDDGCWQRLGSTSLGRVAVVDAGGRILVLPVNFAVEGTTILFRTAPGAGLDHLGRGTVTFQVDATDPYRRSGWSVIAHGRASVDLEAVSDDDTPPRPWAGGHRRHLVRLVVEQVTGREVGPMTPDCDPRGYL